MSRHPSHHGPPIDIVGLGMAEAPPAEPAARDALAAAEVIIGSERQLGAVDAPNAERLPYPSPFSDLPDLIARHDKSRICLLASGDPLCHGVGGWALDHLPRERLRIHPAASSVQVACARAGWRTDRIETISVHGRPLARMRARLRSNRTYALLGDDTATPPAIAAELVAAGFGESAMWVAERLGAADERVTAYDAASLANNSDAFATLHVTLAHTSGPGGVLPEFPGLPDTAYETGAEPGRGLITKREVRLCVLADLAPRAGDVGWDIGAGCGGVAVEWARWNPRGQVYAVEHDDERIGHLRTNRDRFGLDANLHPIHGNAPEALRDLPDPDAVFIGGHDGALEKLLDHTHARLRPGGRLVATGVTETARASLVAFAERWQARLTKLAVARGGQLGGQTAMQPQRPVMIMALGEKA